MRVSAVRLGHATNSSSAHSIVIGSTDPEVLSAGGSYCYGWDRFHLRCRERKEEYLVALVYDSLRNRVSESEASKTVQEVFGSMPDCNPQVDHQSWMWFPMAYNSSSPDLDFIREFVSYVRDNDHVSIVGGNDEDDYEPISGRVHPVTQIRDYGGILTCRKDGCWWTLFNPRTGAKIRLTFRDDAPPYERSTDPELVDLKITDRCNSRCGFCYQGSSPDGKHATFENVEAILRHLGERKVFEVAIGGGEPLLHPQLIDILHTARQCGIVPNLTTRQVQWMEKDDDIRRAVEACCGAFGISTLDPNDIRKIAAWNEQHRDGPCGVLHIPLGCYAPEVVMAALDTAFSRRVGVVLLGYKAVGRGKSFEPFDQDWALDYVRKAPSRVSIDTVLADRWRKRLEEMMISPIYLPQDEGKFSKYIDAVEMKSGDSSYSGELSPFDIGQEKTGGVL